MIRTKEGGIASIQVSDNGVGMDREMRFWLFLVMRRVS